ncbi:unnamed protein product [Clonostachys rhizophaga]|uniref:Uncharacterized protein n=1 Tax=Clonostachys rhizophaga TaxID=160324 RepID=A0A9N9VG21_9HYPO|nr:unnamed protein product [Clonostachys rhizophaga]
MLVPVQPDHPGLMIKDPGSCSARRGPPDSLVEASTVEAFIRKLNEAVGDNNSKEHPHQHADCEPRDEPHHIQLRFAYSGQGKPAASPIRIRVATSGQSRTRVRRLPYFPSQVILKAFPCHIQWPSV